MELQIIEAIGVTFIFISIFLLLYTFLNILKCFSKIKEYVEGVSLVLRSNKIIYIGSLVATSFFFLFINIIMDTSYLGFGMIGGFVYGIWIILFINERHFFNSIKPYLISTVLAILIGLYFLGGSLDNLPSFYNRSRDNLPPQIRYIVETNRLSLETILDSIDKGLFNDFNNLLYQFDSFDEEPETPNYDNLYFTNHIPLTKAIDDIDYLFGILRYGYAAYEYFGGDEVFLEAREDIISEIKEKDGYIYRPDLIKILVDNLGFLQDGHFRIESHQMFRRYNYYVNDNIAFHKDAEGYFTFANGEMFKLTHISSGDIEDFLKPSINEDGKIVYYLGKLYPSSRSEHQIEIKLESDDKRIEKSVTKRIASYSRNTASGNIYRFSEINGIPRIQVGSLFPKSESQLTLLSDFVRDARKLRRERYFIIDLRGNGGGSEAYPMEWIRNYSRQIASYDRISSTLYTSTTLTAYKEFTESLVDQEQKNRALNSIVEIENQDFFPGWAPIRYNLPRQLINNNVIFVLIDGGVASAAETYVRMLRQMDNVVFIGENTAGISLVGNNFGFLLPNSTISFSFGQSLYLNLDLSDDEGIGFRPDFWVPAEYSLDRTVKFIENYFLNR